MHPDNPRTQTATLPNGLRLICRHAEGNVVYCGIAVAVGASSERNGEEGMAHFCEHMAFKGTRRRSATQIINSIESVGGELNAFTGKEDTVYYAAVLKQHFARAVDVLTDIVFNSCYDQQQMDKEVEVIGDEIESYNDSPAEQIYDDFENILFSGSSLGHNILGKAEQLRSYRSSDLQDFARRHYRTDNAVFYAYGDIDIDRAVKLVAAALPGTPPPDGERPAPLPPPSLLTAGARHVVEKHTHQAHVMLGCQTFPANDERRTALFLLNNILGGPGMNSRLNMSLRERRGLVYTVESTMASYLSLGAWTIYFGCDPHDVKRCLRLVNGELHRLTRQPLSERQMAAAKRQLKGQIALACEQRENFAIDLAKSYLHHGWEHDVAALSRRIERLTAGQLLDVARQLFDEQRLVTLIYG